MDSEADSCALAESFTADPGALIDALELWRDDAHEILDFGEWRPRFYFTTAAITLWCDTHGMASNAEPLAEYERLLHELVAPIRVHDAKSKQGYRFPVKLTAEALKQKLEAAEPYWSRIFNAARLKCQQKKDEPVSGNRRRKAEGNPTEAQIQAVQHVLKERPTATQKTILAELKKRGGRGMSYNTLVATLDIIRERSSEISTPPTRVRQQRS